MRRPALDRITGPVDTTAWAHPYPAAPSPRFSTPPATPAGCRDPPAGDTDPADPPKPKAPATRPGPADGELIVRSDWLEQKLTAEKDSGRRNGNQRLASDLGFDDVNSLRQYVEDKKKAEQAQLSETERRAKELEDRERKLAEKETQAAARERVANRRAILVGLGATGTDLDDATALLRVDNDASDDDVTAAAEALKARRPELFGVRPQTDPAAPQLPPAPGGAPAGGAPARQATTGKPGDRGREMARLRGHKAA
ncbi:DUF4355 domain-containing protein [Streptomyces sp. Wb2n-11]|uniref:DUF4355 domain-containing protein n=1 Tax=Streptomyces sp. Wb2n-11 TaxID=1030533 RepID=UPI000AE6197A|nr:DUF4355 domain-containing protein [Streptomyces sp. Wb2n-11]